MSEKKLLNCILTEGIILVVLSLCVLILPKLTMLSYGVMLAGAFIAYGIYKVLRSIMNKNYVFHMVLGILMGLFLMTIGILFLFVPKIDLSWLIALTGVYFILESISSTVYAMKLRNIYHFWRCKLISAIVLFLAGVLIILGVPAISFWLVTVLAGIGLLIKGMAKITIAIGNFENYHV